MNELRLILLLVGAIVIAGVYLYSRRAASPAATAPREPRLGDDRDAGEDDELDELPAVRIRDDIEDEDAAIDMPAAQPAREGEGIVPPVLEEKIIVLNILPQDPEHRFPGSDLLDVFERAGLEYGQYNVFHRLHETSAGVQSVFSVASATEPGSFDISAMPEQAFRGLSMFMVLPGPMRGVDAFADMLATARRIAEQIRGEVLDRQRSTLTRQTAHHIREEIIEFEHRLQARN
ncbi:MAG TPA: cell division protein ZipA [Gammaproteobacteria bacterium]|nr:cell division protein ZipA [Gammaproteobacteria bacterium]